MKRRRVIAGLIGLAVAGVVVFLAWPHPSGPCLATFQQVQPGMTRAEVYATVGGPPGDYTDHGYSYAIPSPGTEFWVANDGLVTVTYGGDGRVTKATAEPITFSSRAFYWNRLLTRLGL
jgi:hypothetical protein